MHRSGFVNIIGSPNVGKSTLMNALVGERLSIVSRKAQTTRHRIMGIVNGDDYQIVYSDTPGVLKPAYKLQAAMMRFVDSALEDADIILYITDTVEPPCKHTNLLEKLRSLTIPIVLLINKIDLAEQNQVNALMTQWQQALPQAQIIPVSALHGFNTDTVMERVKTLLPPSPPYFGKDELTDRSMRFIASEVIREQMLTAYDKEIPYSVEVSVEEYRETPTLDRIRAIIYVERDSQRAIVIGHKGQKLKKVGMGARQELEQFLQKKVFLELHVKVDANWRNDDNKLRRYGYPTGKQQ